MRALVLGLVGLLVASLAMAQTGGARPVLAPLGPSVQGAITAAMTGTTSTAVVSAAAGQFLYIQSCHASNDHATQDTLIVLQSGSGGATLDTLMAPHGGGNDPVYVPWLKVAAGTALFAANVTTGSSTYLSCYGFRSTVSY